MAHDYLTVSVLLDLQHTMAAELFQDIRHPWEALPVLRAYIDALGAQLPADLFEERASGVWVAKNAKVAESASITGPCIIDAGAEIRYCAFIRGSVLVGKGAVVGNSTELKNALLFDAVQVPHYNYVGDSILGHQAHMGAGAITSNVRSDKNPVIIHASEGEIATGMKKLGAILGDRAEIGCNSVLCPGSIVGRDSIVYPTSCVRTVVGGRCIHKRDGTVIPMQAKEEA